MKGFTLLMAGLSLSLCFDSAFAQKVYKCTSSTGVVTFTQSAIDAGKKALDEFGTGTTGSRVANGNYAMHTQLEQELAIMTAMGQMIEFSGQEVAIGSGYAGEIDSLERLSSKAFQPKKKPKNWL